MAGPGKTAIYPLQILVNYWELKPARLAAKLNQLLRQNVTHIVSFVPWQASENDISHGLTKFLQAIADRKMSATLILSPEVGTGALYAGLPKDLAKKEEMLARNRDEQPATVVLAPRIFALPSLHSKELTTRYHQFLTKIDGMIGEMGKEQPELLSSLQLVFTGSFWKYYRPASGSQLAAFRGQNGDRSNAAELAFRADLDNQASLREFMTVKGSGNGLAPKAKENDAVFRAQFQNQAEELFRIRQAQFVRKRSLGVDVVQAELFTPEADPSLSYSNLFQLISRGIADFPALDRLIAEAATRQSMVGESRAAPMIHWTGFGPFTQLTDSEKQYLILKSLLLLGSRGGSVILDEAEWFSLSNGFRKRAELFAESLLAKELELETKVFCLTGHLWSEGKRIDGSTSNGKDSHSLFWPELRLTLDTQARLIASPEALAWEEEAKAVFLEPNFILNSERWRKISSWMEAGRLVVFSKHQPMSDAVRADFEMATRGRGRIDMNLGTRYFVYSVGEGKIAVYEPTAQTSDWKRFVASMLSLSLATPEMGVNDPRVDLVCLKRGMEGGAGRAGLFIFNGSRTSVTTEIRFENDVIIDDLSAVLSRQRDQARTPSADAFTAADDEAEANRFELETPPCGILPISVSGLGEIGREKRIAGTLSGLTSKHAHEAASAELTGFGMTDDFESLFKE
ncbi:MAG: hypothetical protein H7301_13135 [Cryobacterium sp.]|nr:hypothetical protein [Oligoflexia bacterium]